MAGPPISRGFRGRGTGGKSSRIPPGQHLVTDFPVLSAGPTPEPDLPNWRFTLEDGASPLGEWTWEQFNALPQTKLTVDIHCVTTWSKLDTNWRGVSIDTLMEAVGLSEPPGPFGLLHCEGGYTTNGHQLHVSDQWLYACARYRRRRDCVHPVRPFRDLHKKVSRLGAGSMSSR